jgi:hypothetical protein
MHGLFCFYNAKAVGIIAGHRGAAFAAQVLARLDLHSRIGPDPDSGPAHLHLTACGCGASADRQLLLEP